MLIGRQRRRSTLLEVDRAIASLRGARDVRIGVLGHAHMLRARLWRSAGRALVALGAGCACAHQELYHNAELDLRGMAETSGYL